MNWYYPIESESDLKFEESYSDNEAEYRDYLEELREWEFGTNPDNLQWIPPDIVEGDNIIWYDPYKKPSDFNKPVPKEKWIEFLSHFNKF